MAHTIDIGPKIQENEFFILIEIIYICLSFCWLKCYWNNVTTTEYVWNCTWD